MFIPVFWVPDHVEGAVVEGQRQRVTDLVGHAVLEAEPRGEHRRRPHEGLRQVDRGDAAAELDGEGARGATHAPAHVEDVQARRERGQAGEAQRGVLAAPVELVRGREIVDRQRIEILPRRAQGVEDRGAKALAAPVVADGSAVVGGHMGAGLGRTAQPGAMR